eukprot:190989_1
MCIIIHREGVKVIQIALGAYHTCALLSTNGVKCWGYGNYGQLGYGKTDNIGDGPGEMGEDLQEVDLGAVKVIQIALGDYHTCALLSTGGVKCWGYGGYLGYGNTTTIGDEPGEMGEDLQEVDLGEGVKVIQIALGAYHTCALLSTNGVKCWGYGNYGQLGYGKTDNIDGPGEMGEDLQEVDLGAVKVIQIALGAYHTCALLSTNGVKCWGHGSYGQLGYGNKNHKGDGPGEMGKDLQEVDLGLGITVIQIAVGRYHTCALLSTGGVKCWGYGEYGQLGYGHKNDIGDEPGEMGTNLTEVDLGEGITAIQIALGDGHTCALLSTNGVKCWGQGQYGELGYGNQDKIGDGPGEMGKDLQEVDLGLGITVIQIAVGRYHTCALLSTNGVKCWGHGSYGQLGYGNTT